MYTCQCTAFSIGTRESVDSLCRDGTDTPIDTPIAPVLHFAVELGARYVTPHYIQVVLGVWFLFLSALIFCLRPCKSMIMNVSFGYHFMLCGILEIGFVLWVEDISFSTETLATLYVVLPVISHTLILMWAGYKITVCVSHHNRIACKEL